MDPKMKEILRSKWNYIIYEDNQKLLLSVVCCTVGLSDRNIYLIDTEIKNYKEKGEEYIKKLADKISNSPEKYTSRHVELSG
jgi:hypothetical protein